MARSVGLVDGDGDPDFTIIALGSRMQWENRVTADVGRNRLFRRGLRLQQLLVVVERSLHDLVDDVVGPCVRPRNCRARSSRSRAPESDRFGPGPATAKSPAISGGLWRFGRAKAVRNPPDALQSTW